MSQPRRLIHELGRVQDRPRRVICTTTWNGSNRLSERRDARQGRKCYVTDTISGAVRRVPAGGGTLSSGSSRPFSRARGSSDLVPAWSERIAYRQNAVVVGNTEGGRLVRVRSSPMAGRCHHRRGGRSAPPGRRWDRLRRPRKRLGCGDRAEHNRPSHAKRGRDDHRDCCGWARLGLEHRFRQERRPLGSQLRDRPARRSRACSPSA